MIFSHRKAAAAHKAVHRQVAATDMALHKQAAAAHQVVHLQATSTHTQIHKKATNAQMAVQQFKIAAVLHMCSGERIEGQEEMKLKDEKQRWSGKKGVGLEQNGCAVVLSSVCSGTAGQPTAREERKQGIIGQALMGDSAALAQTRNVRNLLPMIRH